MILYAGGRYLVGDGGALPAVVVRLMGNDPQRWILLENYYDYGFTARFAWIRAFR